MNTFMHIHICNNNKEGKKAVNVRMGELKTGTWKGKEGRKGRGKRCNYI